MSNDIRTALKNLLDAMDENGSCQYETLREDGRAALARSQQGEAEPVAVVDGSQVLQWLPPFRRPAPGTKLYTQPPTATGVVPSRDDLIQCLLATRGQSEGVTANAILSMLTAAPSPEQSCVPQSPESDTQPVLRGTGEQQTASMGQAAPGSGWIRCSERLPTEADADSEGNVWHFLRGSGVALIKHSHLDHSAYYGTRWMPTGLKRPNPPAEGDA